MILEKRWWEWGVDGSSVCPASISGKACTLSHPRILERQAKKEAAEGQIAGISRTDTSGIYIYNMYVGKKRTRGGIVLGPYENVSLTRIPSRNILIR